jgi:prophage regulatory protein
MGIKLLIFRDLKERGIPFSYRHLYTLEETGKFPKRVKIGEKRVGWIESEIDTWLEAKANERLQPKKLDRRTRSSIGPIGFLAQRAERLAKRRKDRR